MHSMHPVPRSYNLSRSFNTRAVFVVTTSDMRIPTSTLKRSCPPLPLLPPTHPPPPPPPPLPRPSAPINAVTVSRADVYGRRPSSVVCFCVAVAVGGAISESEWDGLEEEEKRKNVPIITCTLARFRRSRSHRIAWIGKSPILRCDRLPKAGTLGSG